MSYAELDDVRARAGRFAGLFTVAGKRPNEADLVELLDTVTAMIDSEIRAKGYDPDLLSGEVAEALKDVNAWAVLVRSLPQASPGDEAVLKLVVQGNAILKAAGFPGLASGVDVFAALAAVEAGQGGGGPGSDAGSLWDDFPVLDDLTEDDADALEPQWKRGQSL